jgi:uncharacterized ubiquitin-like protein YukD
VQIVWEIINLSYLRMEGTKIKVANPVVEMDGD